MASPESVPMHICPGACASATPLVRISCSSLVPSLQWRVSLQQYNEYDYEPLQWESCLNRYCPIQLGGMHMSSLVHYLYNVQILQQPVDSFTTSFKVTQRIPFQSQQMVQAFSLQLFFCSHQFCKLLIGMLTMFMFQLFRASLSMQIAWTSSDPYLYCGRESSTNYMHDYSSRRTNKKA